MMRSLGAIACALLASAQAQPPAFHSETRLVVLQATVRNARGEIVTGLDRTAFTVFDNGRPQPIVAFSRDDVPVSIGLLIDNSGSMSALRKPVEAAALAFARASNPQDELFVLNFADLPHVDVPLTSDRQVLEAGIARVDSVGGTAVRDAVEMAETYLREHAKHERRAIVIVTDGNDNASVVAEKRSLTAAEASGTVIHAIGLFADPGSWVAKHGRRELGQLTGRTGGVAYYPATIDQIEHAALDLARQIRSQYTIAFSPPDQAFDGSYRTIRVAAAGSEKLAVRTRPGYRATPR